jgi:hypothetical protein
MAGFFVVLGDEKDENNKVVKSALDILRDLCKYGMYSTNLYVKEGTHAWSKPKVSTFADYYGMKANDLIFFFTGRKVYGVGKLVNIGDDCKYWTFKGANKPRAYSEDQISDTRLSKEIMPENRCACFFEPVEYYPQAIDMDEALTAFPEAFKSVRVIQNRTFIKQDDEEAMALFSALHRRNEAALNNEIADWEPPVFDNRVHLLAKAKIERNPEYYDFSIESLLENYLCWGANGIQEEMAIEAAVVNALTSRADPQPFDKMAYVTRQVSASPAKPVEYMEWMDVFGYSVSGYLADQNVPVQLAINRYYVMEIKRDVLSIPTPKRGKETNPIRKTKSVAHQLMKYVDWVAKNYASGNYPMVKGILVANGFDESFIEYCKSVCIRNYNDGYRDATPSVWANFDLIQYTFDGTTINFTKVFPKDEP